MAKLPHSAYRANGVSDNALVSYTVNATLYPSNVEDKRLSWKLTCEDEIDISTYLTITVSEDTSSCVLTCLKAFPEHVIKLTATSLDSGAYGSVNIRCEGIPTGMTVTDTDGNSTLSVKWANAKDFNVNLTNDIGFIGDSYRQNITVKQVTVYGTVDCYGIYFVDQLTGLNGLSLSPSYTEVYSTKNINEVYPNIVTVAVDNGILTITPVAYPLGSAESSSTGVVVNGKRGTKFTNAVLPPKDVYVEIIIACGDIEKTVRVDINNGVQSVSLGSDIVW